MSELLSLACMHPGSHVFPMTHPFPWAGAHKQESSFPQVELPHHTLLPPLPAAAVTCFQLLQPGTQVQVKDTQLPEPGLPLQQHSNNMLPQEATATCDQVHQRWPLCRVCHAQLWEENLAHGNRLIAPAPAMCYA